jgi:amino acid transporter
MAGEAAPSASEAWGYKQELPRVLRWAQSFAVGFSQISITTGIYATLGVVLVSSGALGAWSTWGITAIGFGLVALVYAVFASRVPLTGHGYQYASRYSRPEIGWMVGWLTLLLTGIASMSLAYVIATFVLPPLFGFTSTTANAIGLSVGIIALFAIANMFSTRVTAIMNEIAIYTELVGTIAFGLILFLVVAIHGGLNFGNLTSQGPAAGVSNYFSLLRGSGGSNSPFVAAFVMALFTLFGFEGCANLGEDLKKDARIQVPRAIFFSEIIAGVAGFIFLILIIAAGGNLTQAANAPSAVGYIMQEQLGGAAGKLFLVVVLFSVTAAGLILFLSTTRMVWAMSRDQRFPGWKLTQRIHARFRTPFIAAMAIGVALEVIFLAFSQETNIWNNLIGATSLPPFVIYPTVIIVYWVQRRKLPPAISFRLGRLEVPVIVLSLAWIAFGLSVFKDPSFASAWVYTGGGIVLGILYLLWMRFTGRSLELPRQPATRPGISPATVVGGVVEGRVAP